MQRNQISANFFTKGTLMDIRESNKSKEAERLTNARDRRRAQMLRIMEHKAKAIARHDVKWHWVKGHAGHPGNERADELARMGLEVAR